MLMAAVLPIRSESVPAPIDKYARASVWTLDSPSTRLPVHRRWNEQSIQVVGIHIDLLQQYTLDAATRYTAAGLFSLF